MFERSVDHIYRSFMWQKTFHLNITNEGNLYSINSWFQKLTGDFFGQR